MTREVKTTKQAAADIATIYHYTKNKWGTAQADKYVGNLIVEIERHGKCPEFLTRKESRLARRLNLDPEQVRSFLYEKHYRCYFHFDYSVLHVLSIWQ